MPPPRENHAGAYDLARGRLVVFSGYTSTNAVLLSDTWELDGAVWRDVTPAVSPPSRWGHAMAYDVGRSRIVLFGGSTTTGDTGSIADTWEWDGNLWTQLLPGTSPAGRLGHAMTSDWSGGRVVMFGGRDATSMHRNDTWAWNGIAWTQLATTGPPPRCCFDLASDLGRGRIVLFGGWDAGNLGDTWEFDGVQWQQMAPAISPAPRWGHRLAHDVARSVTVLQGGFTGSSETWEWNGATWSLRTSAAVSCFNQTQHFGWSLGRVTMFGGRVSGGVSNETWAWGVRTPALLNPYGTACAGPAGTPQLVAQAGGLPWIGQTFVLAASPVTAFALFALGWSDTASGSVTLPYSLAPHGASGCSLFASLDAVFGVAGGPIATIPVLVPWAPAIVGTRFFVQAVSFDPNANALGMTVSNGAAATIGWR